MDDLSELLRETIRKSGLSANELGIRAKVDRGIITRFLKGERSPTLETAQKLLAALGCRVRIIAGRPRPRSKE